MLNNLQQMHFKTSSKRVIQKAAEATGDLSGNKLTSFKKLTTKCFKDTYR